MKCYKSFDELYIDQEIESILNIEDPVHLKFDSTRKDMLFLLGMLFAAGKQIQLDNLRDVEAKVTESKSFDKMALYWHKNKLKPIVSKKSNKNSIFMICPVRNASQEVVDSLRRIKENLKNRGYHVHYPGDDTNKLDSVGYNICLANANAIGESNVVGIYYDPESTGTLFDLGVAYFLSKQIPTREYIVFNKDDIIIDKNKFNDRLISLIIEDQETKEVAKSMTRERNRYKI
ncbi:MAG TPA: hypothetical protein PLT65_02235 [Bacilli bacterium]|nr:hypothetical protein [Bacilli bacterium]